METSKIFRLPIISDKEAAGRLTSIPGIVEAEATNPINVEGVPRLVAKGFKTGFLDIVELRMANAPIAHNARKKCSSDLDLEIIVHPYSIITLALFLPSVKLLLYFYLRF